MCNYLLALCAEDTTIAERELVNGRTKDGNSVLMWSSWSASLDVVKLLVRHRADTAAVNRNGCSVAHWAASGGGESPPQHDFVFCYVKDTHRTYQATPLLDLAVCRYLHETVGLNFDVENFAGNTPLCHAVAYGRFEVARWLKEELDVEDVHGTAKDLAMDFIAWADMGLKDEEAERRNLSSLFNSLQDWKREKGEETEGAGEK